MEKEKPRDWTWIQCGACWVLTPLKFLADFHVCRAPNTPAASRTQAESCGNPKNMKKIVAKIQDGSMIPAQAMAKPKSFDTWLPEKQEEWREKERERVRKWREVNPEKERERARKWREANPEKERERRRKRYEANSEKEREYVRKRYAVNSEKQREYFRKRYAASTQQSAADQFFVMAAAAQELTQFSTDGQA
jgi:hypothetical protein